jgi:hypothetical protein
MIAAEDLQAKFENMVELKHKEGKDLVLVFEQMQVTIPANSQPIGRRLTALIEYLTTYRKYSCLPDFANPFGLNLQDRLLLPDKELAKLDKAI